MKNSRKIILIVLLALLLIATIIVAVVMFTRGNTPNNPQGGDDQTHQHEFSTQWSSNETEHWHAATCGHDVMSDRAAHNFGTDNVCDTCGYTKAQGGNQGGSDKPDGGQGGNQGGNQGSDTPGGGDQGDDPAPNNVTVTFAINYSGGTNPPAQTVTQGNSVTLPTVSRTGYTLDGWYDSIGGGTLVGNAGASYVVNASVTLYAHWTANQGGGGQGDDPTPNNVTVTFAINYNGGTNPSAQTVTQGNSVILPGVSRTGYTLDGWYTESSGGTLVGKAGASYVANASVTLYAHWTANQQGGGDNPDIGQGGQGDNDTESDTSQFDFETCDGGYMLTKYNGTAAHVNIPDTYNDLPVVGIGEEAFYECRSLMSVTIPDSVTSLEHSAFAFCDNLSSVTIPNSVTDIGRNVFDSCENLQSIFYNGTIADWCRIIFNGYASTPMYYAENFYIKKNGAWQEVTEIEILDGITEIGNYQFYGFDNLTSVTIPDSVKTIDEYSFADCENLATVNIGSNSKLESIGSSAFWECSSLTSINIPDSVKTIGEYSFADCENLTMVNFGANSELKSIGGSAFGDCYLLTSITIPDSVTSIGDRAFHNCGSLETVNIGANSKLEIIDKDAFESCRSLTSITIPDSVTSIGWRAFGYCYGLTSIFIPKSVINMDGAVFEGCSNITIYCEAATKPSGWPSGWNCYYHDYYCPVVWGATRQDAEQH